MCDPVQCIIDKLGGLAFDKAIKAGKYVRDYKDNLQELQEKLTELGDYMKIITIKVGVANAYGEEIWDNVSNWQTDADSLKKGIEQLISTKANIRCIACSCPNIVSRYKFSKTAEEKMLNVDDLITKYNLLRDHISHPGSHYTENLKKLQEKLEDLGDYTEKIGRKVLAAEGRGEEIEVDVLRWQTDAANLKDGIDQLIRENTTKASDIKQLIRESTTEASICSTECPSPDDMQLWQYRFGKQAVEKIADADGLIMKYNNFKDQISHPGSHYKENLQKLQVRLRDIGDCMDTIKGKVSKASDRGHEIEVNVSHWQTDADSLKDGIEQLIRESTAKASICSTECPCPDIIWQYQFSKHAGEKIADADGLIIKYNNFKDPISHPKARHPESLSNNNYVNFDSRASVVNDIIDALENSKVNMIGVFGLGGIGKTTLVKEVCEKMRQDRTFDEVAFAAVSKNINVMEIQSQLADTLKFEFKKEEGRKTQLLNKFTNGKRYLVILDDIWEKVEIEAIGIPLTHGSTTGCKVVLTSRKKDLLGNRMRVDKPFPIAELHEQEAWTLFKNEAGDYVESEPELRSLAYDVCKRCEGLPVAINAIGGALRGKPIYAWNNALDMQKRYESKNIPDVDPNVWASLKCSYDMLQSSNAKSCFLLCCLFQEDVEISIDDLMRHCVARSVLSPNPGTLEEARNAVRTLVDHLKSVSLLSTGNHENVVKIHDVIRDVGISIAHEEKAFLVDHGVVRWPIPGPSYSAISISFKGDAALPDGLEYPQLHTLMVDNSELYNLEVPDNFFDGMMQLTVLTFTRVHMRRLPSSLARLKNLRMLCLNECQLNDITILNDLKSNLEVLSFQGSSIEALPPKIGQVTSLRVLDLRNCYRLIVIPRGVISNLTDLEELYFPREFGGWGATKNEQKDLSSRDNVSLEELRWSLANRQLTTLHIHVPDGELLPKEELIFANLKGFKISVGSEFHYGEDLITRACRLKLEGIQLRNEFIPLVDKAEVLVLRRVSSVRPLQLFNKLTLLIIEHFKLKYLFSPTTARELVHLEELEVTYSEIMEGIIGFEGQNDANEIIGEVKFSKLKRLELISLPNLISFHAKKETMETTMGSSSARAQPLFNEKVIFPVLKTLSIDGLSNIINIWDKQSIGVLEKQGCFGQLIVLNVCRCKKLMHVVPYNMHPMIKNLAILTVYDCETMEAIIEFASPALEQLREIQEKEGIKNDIIVFPLLVVVQLEALPKLKSFYTETPGFFFHKVAFPVLEELYIKHLCKITRIWDSQPLSESEKEAKSLCKLISIYLDCCVNLEYVLPFYMLPLLKNLQELNINGCLKMEVIISNNSKDLALLPNIKSLSTDTQLSFSDKVASPALEQLAEIQEKEGINNDIIVFPQLKSVQLQKLPELKSFCAETKGFFSHKVAFPVLEKLNFKGLCKITRIWDSQPLSESKKEAISFGELTNIKVINCVNLEYVLPCHMLPLLKNLQALNISNCLMMEVIISNNPKEKEAIKDDTIRCPVLETVVLEDLPNLKSLSTDYTQLCFSNKDAFPVLDKIVVENLKTKKEISIEDENREKIDLQIIEFLQGGNEVSMESVEGDSAAGSVFHSGIICDGCDVRPIAGPRFKSIVKKDYDLCSVCFSIMGVPTDYVKRDRPYDSFERLCDPERSASGEESDPNGEALDEDLEIPKEISMKQATKLWKLFLKIFRYGKQSKEEYGTSGKVSDNSDEALDKDLELCMNVISMKRANAWWKMYLQIFRNGKQSKEECGTSGKESNDHNGEEFDEDLEILTNEISMEDALIVLQKIYFKNIQNMMESKGDCGTSSKENDHNGEKLDEDLEAPTNEISMEDALIVLEKIFKEEYGKSPKEIDESGEES